MSLLQRKPRPIKRDGTELRDDRCFIIACDDTYAPEQYFNFFRISRVHFEVVGTPADGTCSAPHVLARLEQFKKLEPDDERWMFLDTDHYSDGSHRKTFMQTISEAKSKGIKVAISKPCFEFWLLLHHVEETTLPTLPNCKAVEQFLRNTVGEYNKSQLKPEHYPVKKLVDAYRRAERLDDILKTKDIPDSNSTRVYRIWKSILEKALPSQFPEELGTLLNEIKGSSAET